MRKKEMVKIIGEELERIPRGSLDQNIFRAMYNDLREKSLSQSSENIEESRKKVFNEAVEFLKKDMPDFEPEYDKEYFA